MKTTIVHAQKMEVLAAAYDQHAADLRRYFRSYTHDAMAAEDMTHDLFLKLMRLDVIQQETVRSLLFITASHMMVDDARHKTYVRQYEREALASMTEWELPSAPQRIDGDFLQQNENRCICMMSEKRAQVYKMYFHEERNSKEIADTLHLSVRTVEGHIYHSRVQMRAYLQKACNE